MPPRSQPPWPPRPLPPRGAPLPPGIAARLGFGSDQAARMQSALNLMEGIPDDVALRLPYWKSGAPLPEDLTGALRSGERGLMWYAPLVPMVPDTVQAFEALVDRVCLQHGFEPLITLTSLSDGTGLDFSYLGIGSLSVGRPRRSPMA